MRTSEWRYWNSVFVADRVNASIYVHSANDEYVLTCGSLHNASEFNLFSSLDRRGILASQSPFTQARVNLTGWSRKHKVRARNCPGFSLGEHIGYSAGQ